mgnify:CR=1 FL=1
MSENKKLVAIVMGSDSDWPVMKFAAQMLADFDVPYEAQVISAHRTPDLMFKFAEDAAKEGYQIIIAGAGGAAGWFGYRQAEPVCMGSRLAPNPIPQK